MGKKITEIEFKKIQAKYKQEVREYYLDMLDEILTPILKVENTLLNDELSQFLLANDFENMVKEVITGAKKYKFIKYPSASIEEYIEAQENNVK